MIWFGAMMLEHLGEKEAAASIVAAIERTLGERTLRTTSAARGYHGLRQGRR
jgi:tartrate dehydrogenase/decarboxylase / D-malate dehydrogenase